MPSRGILACAVCLLACCPGAALGQDDPPDGPIEPLIADLGSPVYEDREKATELLHHMAPWALDALREAGKSPDEEVRVRANGILKDHELGISPQWPAEMVLQARHHDQVLATERSALMASLTVSLREDFVPFLLARGSRGASNESAACLRNIAHLLDTPEAARRVITLVREPEGKFEVQALAWAWLRMGDALQAALVAAGASVKPDGEERLHAQAARDLEATGRPEEAIARWEAVRQAPPEHSALDVYAALRICDVHQRSGRFAEAAQAAAAAAQTLRKAVEADTDLGPVADAQGGLEMVRKMLEKKARKFPGGQGPARDLELPADELKAQVEVLVLDEAGDLKLEEFRRGLALVGNSLCIAVRPAGARLLSVDPSLLHYEPAEKVLRVVVRGIPCSEPLTFDPGPEPKPVVVYSGDGAYFYLVEAGIAHPHLIAAFQKDYVVRFRLGPRLSTHEDLRITIGGLPYEPAELTKGIRLDRLYPSPLHISIEGTSPDGDRRRMTFDVTVAEPEIQPAEPGAESEEEQAIENILRLRPRPL
jgi:hypothetical protein